MIAPVTTPPATALDERIARPRRMRDGMMEGAGESVRQCCADGSFVAGDRGQRSPGGVRTEPREPGRPE